MSEINRILIGGSAGSIENLQYLLHDLEFTNLPPVVCAIHYSGTLPLLSTLNIKGSDFNVKYVERPLTLERRTIYVPHNNYHIILEENGDQVRLFEGESFSYSKPSIDLLFLSCLGQEAKTTLAILLSGANTDGQQGFLELSRAGAMCAVVNPDISQFSTMPSAGLKAVPSAYIVNKKDTINSLIERINDTQIKCTN